MAIPPPEARPIPTRLRSLFQLMEHDVRHHARWDFPHHPSPPIALLEGYGRQWAEPIPLVIQLAALRLADGDLERLDEAVTMAKLQPAELVSLVRRRHGRFWRVLYLMRS
ncbi:MAG: hypothetical protein ABJD11_12495 [Gemmatimonadota bacterium]